MVAFSADSEFYSSNNSLVIEIYFSLLRLINKIVTNACVSGLKHREDDDASVTAKHRGVRVSMSVRFTVATLLSGDRPR